MKAEKIALFFSELSTMIFEDLRKNAQEHLSRIVEKGKAVYEGDSSGYIAGEIRSIISELARACLKNAFRQMCVTICGRFVPNEGRIAGYVT